jgi:tryptophan synthase alpha chain
MITDKLLIPFLTAGFPETGSLLELAPLTAGCDYLEVGLPHSDALADGPTIQDASYRAIRNGMHLELLCEQFSQLGAEVPPGILFSYYHPLLCRGLRNSLRLWSQAGGRGVLVPDLPIEEAQELREVCGELGLKTIFLVAPTSSPERVRRIAEASQEFLYLVSVTGVTGTQNQLRGNLQATISTVREVRPELPVVIGFGIRDRSSARWAMEQGADGVVVGSALLKDIEAGKTPDKLLAELRLGMRT